MKGFELDSETPRFPAQRGELFGIIACRIMAAAMIVQGTVMVSMGCRTRRPPASPKRRFGNSPDTSSTIPGPFSLGSDGRPGKSASPPGRENGRRAIR